MEVEPDFMGSIVNGGILLQLRCPDGSFDTHVCTSEPEASLQIARYLKRARAEYAKGDIEVMEESGDPIPKEE